MALLWATAGALGSLLPLVKSLEQKIGLGLLFHLRGPRPAPEEAVIVRIDQNAARSIRTSTDPERYFRCQSLHIGGTPEQGQALPAPTRLVEWPRCVHAELIRTLHQAGARLIAFDVLFRPRPGLPGGARDVRAEEDRILAQSMHSAGNVLLSRRLDATAAESARTDTVQVDLLSALSADLEGAALGSGVFLLPDAETGRFDRFLAFAPNSWLVSTFPSLAVQSHLRAHHEPFRKLLNEASPAARELMSEPLAGIDAPGATEAAALLTRQLFVSEPGILTQVRRALDARVAAGMPVDTASAIQALASMYGGPAEQYFNFYGPPGSIRHIGYDEALDPAQAQRLAQLVKDKVVFVGRAELHHPEKDDYFHTVFSGDGGVDTSGVELAATAFANLLHGDSIRPAAQWLTILIAFAGGFLVVAFMGFTRGIWRGVLWVAGIMLAYCAAVAWTFSRTQVWLPMVLPVGLMGGLGLILSGTWIHTQTRRYARQMRTLFGHFVPPEVVDKLISGRRSLGDLRESLQAACVATDVERYVSVAEGMRPSALSDYLDRYFAVLFKVVARHDGLVTDVVGDAMMAIWPDRGLDRAVRIAVCDACLDMLEGVETFNHESGLARLPTRIGVDWGPIALGPVGAGGHYEFRAIGDPVNTSNRIQNFNKQMGTWLLVSQPLIAGLDEFLTREVGTFQLRGKQHAVTLHEVLCRSARATPGQMQLCERFGKALARARSGQAAKDLLGTIARDFPGDGPTDFYLRMLAGQDDPDLRVIQVA